MTMTPRHNFLTLLISLLPFVLFVASCEKLVKQIKSEMRRGAPEKVRVSTCCWCIDANTNANVLSNYISKGYCEDLVKDSTKSFASCKQIKVDSERCSFQRLTEKQGDNPNRPVDWSAKFREKRTTADVKIHGSEEYITALTPQPLHCDRKLTSTGLAATNDPRCSAETCKCFADENLPWNCELVLVRKDGKKESLGMRQKIDREHGCDATACRELFAREVYAFCPSFN